MNIQTKQIRLRVVEDRDCELLWQWANDPDVRASAFSSEPIPWDDHVRWFERKRQDPKSHIFIALNLQDMPIGQIRFDLDENESAEIDVSVDRDKRGLGYGKILIESAVASIFTITSVKTVHALIKSNNDSSINAFEKAGFQKFFEESISGNSTIRYILKRGNR
jgi:UDP-2,4-diacetamido-2,4,6-trideoxy-beta-L-altropyranose hydrolase